MIFKQVFTKKIRCVDYVFSILTPNNKKLYKYDNKVKFYEKRATIIIDINLCSVCVCC